MDENEDLDALAAEYVLGTLAADERAHAEALLAIDPGFSDIVRQWERRLGELNVMVEAVEPPTDVWERIKSSIGPVMPIDEVRLAPVEPAPATANMPPPLDVAPQPEGADETEPLEAVGSLALSQLLAKVEPAGEAEAKPAPKSAAELSLFPPSLLASPPAPSPARIEHDADASNVARRMRRWRRTAIAAGILVLALAALIVVSQVDPGIFPPGGFRIPHLIGQAATPSAPAAARGSRLIAVLQQQSSPPAFLLSIDPASRTVMVRRVSARQQPGHAYELWLIAKDSSTPQALGVIGSAEFTQVQWPANLDPAALQAATFIVTFEPAGGSKTGAPSGPTLFTGKPLDTAAPPAAKKM
ncbi:MAG: anti-sigma factor [Xanthobacteraceae bacterium]